MIAQYGRVTLFTLVLCASTTIAAAEKAVPVGTKGTFKVIYSFNAVGDKTLGSDLIENWNNKMVVTMVFPVKAEAPRKYPPLTGRQNNSSAK